MSQYGVRPARSTELASARMTTYIANKLEEKRMVLGILLDVSAAFNCIRHSLFEAMLGSIGYDTTTVKRFKSYLSNRRQRIEIGKVRSDWTALNEGTPQGGVLGPQIFCIFINFVLKEIQFQLLIKRRSPRPVTPSSSR